MVRPIALVTCVVMMTVLSGCDPMRPMANFTGEPLEGYAPLTVRFFNHSDSGTSAAVRYVWNFGDGSPAVSAEAPTHTYTKPGVYAVSLEAITPRGRDAMTRRRYVRVLAPRPEVRVDFDAAPSDGVAPLAVAFTDLTEARDAEVRGWHWQFGDGAVSEEQHPRHVYQAPGTYTVTLTVNSSLGRFRAVQTNFVTADSPASLVTATRAVFPLDPVLPGEGAQVTVLIAYAGIEPMTSLGLVETLPANWAYDGLSAYGTMPDVVRYREDLRVLEFAWTTPPAFPVQLTYRIHAAEHCTGDGAIKGHVAFRYGGPGFESVLPDTRVGCLPMPEGEPPTEGEGEPPAEGEGEPPMEGEGEPPAEGEGEPPAEGEGEPPAEGEGEPPMEGEGEPPAEGEGEPPMEGEGEPPAEGEGEPPAEGEGEPPAEGEGEPPMEGEGEPPMEGEGEPGEDELLTVMHFTRASADHAYVPGVPLELFVYIDRWGPGTATDLVLAETLPAGWSFGSVTSLGGPDLVPPPGAVGEVYFGWSHAPEPPLFFSYTLVPPADAFDLFLLEGVLSYRVNGVFQYSNEEQSLFRRFHTVVMARRVPAETGYTAGGPMDITIEYAKYGAENLLVFGFVEELPAGWTYLGLVDGGAVAPAVYPEPGAQGVLEFAWIAVPSMPGHFTYRVAAPEAERGLAAFRGYGLYRFTGGQQETNVTQTYLPRVRP